MHLTNYSVNKMSEKYVHEPDNMGQICEINNGTKRTLSALFKQLDSLDIDTSAIKESISYSCQGIMQMLSNMISHNSQMSKGEPDGKMFQVFGFDILLDSKYKAWILEINDHPSFNIYFDNEFMNSKPSDEQILSLVDLHVKK